MRNRPALRSRVIRTRQLLVVPATASSLRAAVTGPSELGAALDAAVAPDWPPEHLDANALNWVLGRLTGDPGADAWWMHWIVLDLPASQSRPKLIGSCGFKGPPDERGVIEVGYGIVPSHHRRGYASEATHALVAWAFSHGASHAIAHTLPHLEPSLGVMRKVGMKFEAELVDPVDGRVVRHGVSRREFERNSHYPPP